MPGPADLTTSEERVISTEMDEIKRFLQEHMDPASAEHTILLHLANVASDAEEKMHDLYECAQDYRKLYDVRRLWPY